MSALVARVEALTLVASSPGRVLGTRGPVPAGVLLASRHRQRASRSGKTWRTEAEGGSGVVVAFFGRSWQADSGVLADGGVATLSVGQRGPVVT